MGSHKNEASVRLEMARTVRAADGSFRAVCDQAFLPLGLNSEQCEILLYLYGRPCEIVDAGELMHSLQLPDALLTAALKKLKQKGYIHYAAGRDGQKAAVSLTVKALDIRKQLAAALTRLEEAAFVRMTDEECAEVQTILQRWIRHIDRIECQMEDN